MGNGFSTPPPPPPSLVLIPPKFNRNINLGESIFQTPVESFLHTTYRSRLFEANTGHFARLLLTPNDNKKNKLVIDASISDDLTGSLSVRSFPLLFSGGDKNTSIELSAPISENESIPFVRGAFFPLKEFSGVRMGLFSSFPLGQGSVSSRSNELKLTTHSFNKNQHVIGGRVHGENFASGIRLNLETQEATAWLMGKIDALTLFVEADDTIDRLQSDPLSKKRFRMGGKFSDGGWDVSMLGSSRGDYLLGVYTHHALTRRVVNPFEKEEVVGIANYVDIAGETRYSAAGGGNPAQATMELAANWQINKNWLASAKLSSKGTVTIGARLRSWCSPGLLLGGSLSFDPSSRSLRPGCSLLIENVGEVEYERPSRSGSSSQPSVEMVASLEEARSSRQLVRQSAAEEAAGPAPPLSVASSGTTPALQGRHLGL